MINLIFVWLVPALFCYVFYSALYMYTPYTLAIKIDHEKFKKWLIALAVIPIVNIIFLLFLLFLLISQFTRKK